MVFAMYFLFFLHNRVSSLSRNDFIKYGTKVGDRMIDVADDGYVQASLPHRFLIFGRETRTHQVRIVKSGLCTVGT